MIAPPWAQQCWHIVVTETLVTQSLFYVLATAGIKPPLETILLLVVITMNSKFEVHSIHIFLINAAPFASPAFSIHNEL